MVYLKRAVKRRFGSAVHVRLVTLDSDEARRSNWRNEQPLPLVIINGTVFSKGVFSLKKITEQLSMLQDRR